MESAKIARYIAAVLILISGIVHVAAGVIVGAVNTADMYWDVVFGLIYVILGLGLFIGKRVFLYLAVILPLVGGVGGVLLYLNVQPIEFDLAQTSTAVAFDVIVILLCAYLLLKKPTPSNDEARASETS